MATVLLLVSCVLFFRTLGRSGLPGQRRAPLRVEVSPSYAVLRLAMDVREGVRILARLDEARRDRLDRPWR